MAAKVVPITESGQGDVEKGPKSEGERPLKPWHLYRYADGFDKFCIAMGTVFGLGVGASAPAFSIIMGDSMDALSGSIEGKDMVEAILPTIWLIVYIMVGLIVVGFIMQTALSLSAERQAAAMRLAYFKAVVEKDTAWYDTHDPASLPSKMSQEVQTVFDAIGMQYGVLMQTVGQLIAGFIVGYIKGWEVSLVLTLSLPAFIGSGVYIAWTIGAQTSETQSWYSKAGAVAEEGLMAIRTVAAFGGEPREAERYYSNLNEARKGGTIAGLHMGLSFGTTMGSSCGIYALGFWYCAYHILGPNKDTPSNFIMAFFSVFMGVASLQQIGTPTLAWLKGMAAAKTMFAVIDAPSKIETAEASTPLPESVKHFNTLHFKDVHFHYPSRPDVKILKGLSLQIEKGKKIALVGESGSGKSTTIQLLERFYNPVSGSIEINGIPLQQLGAKSWRSILGYVGQEPVLFATTIMENIKGGNSNITDDQCINAAKEAQAFDFVNEMPKKFLTFVGPGGGQLSGGQKQRVAIARALVKRPQLLLLDEATSALDNKSEKEVQAIIDKLQATSSESLTTISIAHRLSTVRNSDIIFVFKSGAVVESGTHASLMDKKAEYFNLVQSQDTGSENQTPDNDTAHDNIEEVRLTPNGAGEEATIADTELERQQSSGEAKTAKTEADLKKEREEMMKTEKFKLPYGRLMGLAKPQWGWFFPAFVALCLSGSAMPLQGYFMAKALGPMYICDPELCASTGMKCFRDLSVECPPEPMQEELDPIILWFVILSLCALFGEFGKYGVLNYIQEHVTLKLRSQAYEATLKQDIGFFDDAYNSPSSLTALLAKKTSQVSTAIGIQFGNQLGAFFALVIGIVLGFLGSWQLALAVLATLPIMMILMAILMAMFMGMSAGSDAYSQAYETATESVMNIRTVRALVCEQKLTDIFQAAVEEIAAKEKRKAPSKGLAMGIGNGFMYLIFIVAFLYGAWLLQVGAITDTVAMYQALFCMMFGAMGAGMAAGFLPNAAEGMLAAYDVFKVLDRESKIDPVNPTGSIKDMGDGTIELKGINFFYPHRPENMILKDLNLSVTSGQAVALVGPSGCGKSTVFQLLQRFYDPSEGQVLVGGQDLKSFDIKWWRQQIGFVGQEPILFDLSVEDNVRYGKLDASKEELEEAAKRANMDYVISGKVKWTDYVGARGGQLSGGQKQRCAIARALVRNPSILILDEATSALDSASEGVVQDALDKAKLGRTTFSIAHRLTTIQDSDVIFVFRNGAVSEKGSHQDLLNLRGQYWNLVQHGKA
eukprot:TRINITY_DN32215_c0_g1_i1.p1 TRINITY_DN32215_c0_g1~~TRINITY_DN32215_c0_g1_i1.p1  ORF type:complete len:1281 (+),score=294.96 TRINITY_DN32215_c0_g1_i1:135-3977(+)